MQSIFIIFAQNIAMLVLFMCYIRGIGQAVFDLLKLAIPGKGLAIFKFGLADQHTLLNRVAILFQFHFEQILSRGGVEIHPQFRQYVVKTMILFLHLLVVTPALLRLSRFYEICHAFKDLVCSAQLFEYKVPAVQLQKPMIEFVLFVGPVAFLDVLCLSLSGVVLETRAFLLRLLFDLFPGQADVTLFAEERLEIVARYDFLVVFNQSVNLLRIALITLYFDFARAKALKFLSAASFAVGGLHFVLFVRLCFFGWISVAHWADCSIKEIQILNFKQPLLKNIHATVNSHLQRSFPGARSILDSEQFWRLPLQVAQLIETFLAQRIFFQLFYMIVQYYKINKAFWGTFWLKRQHIG